MDKMIECPRICSKTLHQKEEERIDEKRMLIIMELSVGYMRIYCVIVYTLEFVCKFL